MKFKRTLGIVLAAVMIMSVLPVGIFAAENTLFENKTTNIEYGTPVIDGELDDVWEKAEKLTFDYDRNGIDGVVFDYGSNSFKPDAKDNLAPEYENGSWAKVLWDQNNLYVYFYVVDDTQHTDAAQRYNRDSIEVYLDEYNDKADSTGACTRWAQICIDADGGIDDNKASWVNGYEVKTFSDHYVVELCMPLTTRNIVKGDTIGFDLAINCQDDAGESARDHSLSWNDRTNLTWKYPKFMGNAVLVGENAPTTPNGETPEEPEEPEIVIPTDRELPEGAVVRENGEGWVPSNVTNGVANETQIKWQVYDYNEETYLKFTYWPEETGKVATTTIYSKNLETGGNTDWGSGDKSAWGPFYADIDHVIVGDGITAIEGGFLVVCESVKTAEIPATLTKVGGTSFEGCGNLASITVAGNEPVEGLFDISNVTSVGDYLFDGCSKMTAIKLSADLTGKLGTEVFKRAAFTEIEIPAGVTEIASEAFALCSKLTKVTVKGMDTTISENAFKNIDGGTVNNDNTANVTVYGYAGSAVQTNCAEYGIAFVALDAASYTVTYDANGGEKAPAAQIKVENVALTLTKDEPTRAGYTFKGWATTADGEVVYASGASYTENADVTLYAVWKERTDADDIVTGHVSTQYYENNWEFNRTTKVLTITSIRTGWNETGNVNNEGSWKEYITEIEEVVLEGVFGKISSQAFNGATNLKKITLTEGVDQIDWGAFHYCSNLETVCIEGQPVIEGLLDFSEIKGNGKGGSCFATSDVFNTDTKATAIALGDVYSDEYTLKLGNLPNNIQTIYGATEYLETFCADNELEFVPFGKSAGNNVAWMIEDGALNLVGEGAITSLANIEAYAADVKTVVIPATITELADGAFASLTALESATFKGNAPTVADGAKPFGTQADSFYVTVSASATGFDGDTWCGYTLNKLTYIAGDLNEDGEVTIADAVLLAQYLASWNVEVNEQAADTNGDGEITIADAVLLAQYLAGWNVELVGPKPTPDPDPDPGEDDSYGDNEIESDDLHGNT